MKAPVTIVLLLVIFQASAFAQTKVDVESLLSKIGETANSINIIKNKSAEELTAGGKNILPILTDYFTDTTKVKTYSDCLDRNLTSGEIAIIVADRIEMMPYATLTGMQNCILTFCEKNPNFIEYYLDYVRDDVGEFQNKYKAWLQSNERKEWPMYKEDAARKNKK
jgi:hypothetical protein